MAKSTAKSTNRKSGLKEPWKKGQSGNPKGYKKGQRNYKTLYREALVKIAETQGITPEEVENLMHVAGIKQAMKGNFSFYKEINDRIHGKVEQKTDITSGGEKIVTNTIIFADLDEANR